MLSRKLSSVHHPARLLNLTLTWILIIVWNNVWKTAFDTEYSCHFSIHPEFWLGNYFMVLVIITSWTYFLFSGVTGWSLNVPVVRCEESCRFICRYCFFCWFDPLNPVKVHENGAQEGLYSCQDWLVMDHFIVWYCYTKTDTGVCWSYLIVGCNFMSIVLTSLWYNSS